MEMIQSLADILVEVVVVLVGLGLLWVSKKGKEYLEQAKQKDTTGILDMITDSVVALVEKEFNGVSGMEKRDKAVEMTLKFLREQGITGISKERIMADIENAVLKLKDMQTRQSVGYDFAELKDISGIIATDEDR